MKNQEPSPASGMAMAVQHADDARYSAMLRSDIGELDGLLSDGLCYTHSSAHRQTKCEYLASLASGRIKYLQAQRDDVRLRVYGDVAVMNGNVQLKAVIDGVLRVLENRFLSVWKRDDGGWRMLAWASTPLPAAS